MQSIESLRANVLAARDAAPDLVIRGGRVINVFTKEILEADIALRGDTILGVGQYECENVFDAAGAYIAPGLIDSHVHIESSMASPAPFARVILPCGTTTIIADPHEIANVFGAVGIKAMLELTDDLPLDVRFMLPSCVPATPFEHSGATMAAKDLLPFLEHERVLGLGEVMDFVSLLAGEESMMEKLAAFRGRPIDGHAPLLSGHRLNAYCLAGPMTDHECSDADEVLEKLRAGMRVLVRIGSAAFGIREILTRLAEEKLPLERVLFCTDDKHIETIREEGHINHILAVAVACGIDPLDAVRMATINAAEAYRLSGIGAIAPGYRGNLVLFDDLKAFRVRDVFVGGERYTPALVRATKEMPAGAKTRIDIAPLAADAFALRVGETAPVIDMIPGQLVNTLKTLPVRSEGGVFVPGDGLNTLAVLERHHASGHIGLGIVRGMGITGGAMASTVAHDSHNLVVLGDNDADMFRAIEALQEQGGGFVAIGRGEVLARIPLPIAGLMSNAPVEEILADQQAILKAAHEVLSVPEDCDPLIALSFLALPVIPEARVTDVGLFSVIESRFVEFR